MNLPTHLHITWQDDNTLRVDSDYGTQTRVFHFGNWTPPQPRKRSWQGNSIAVWASRRGGRGGPRSAGYLRITTTDLLAGYLRKNGVPYAENASVLEYVDLFKEPNGAAVVVWTGSLGVHDPRGRDAAGDTLHDPIRRLDRIVVGRDDDGFAHDDAERGAEPETHLAALRMDALRAP